MRVEPNERVKMIFLIKRREGSSRDELIMQWYKNHMPAVIASQDRAIEQGRDGASRYIAQLFNTSNKGDMRWDGMAQLWFAEPQKPTTSDRDREPTDTFQQKAEPYFSWATREYVVIDGSAHLSVAPLTLNDPYPSTRSGFFRVNYLVPAQEDIDYDAFYKHWLDVHVPNINDWMNQVGGFRYVVSHSIYPELAPYAGMAELYFHVEEDWHKCQSLMRADGMEKFVDSARMDIMFGDTEMVGVP
ncbi:MAG: EthD domain-containing protein [Gammaproteobacteria bacterium]|nr:EthD domain-containing protein [Gammaproteobacteria bacterium]